MKANYFLPLFIKVSALKEMTKLEALLLICLQMSTKQEKVCKIIDCSMCICNHKLKEVELICSLTSNLDISQY